MEKDTIKNKFSFEEPVSKAHKDSVLNAVQAELAINRKSKTSSFSKSWLSLPLAVAFSAVVYFQFVNPVNKSTDLETAMSENLLMELAALSPEEIAIVEDLEFMDALDKLSPEELEEVLL
jgi:hypothetical protein